MAVNQKKDLGKVVNNIAQNAAKDAAKTVNSVTKDAAKTVNSVTRDAAKAVNTAAGNAAKAVGDAASLTKDALAGAVDQNTRNEMFKKICALIPNQVNNATVVNAFELMRKEQKLLKKDFTTHLKANESAFKKHEEAIKKAKGYVEDQNLWTDVAYGVATMQYSGCEVFATFNAIFNITGKHLKSLPAMISEYEKDGIVLSGKFGTSPKAISDFLTREGFKTVMTTEEKEFDKVGKENESLILTMYNDKDDISQEVHTVNISKENNKFTAHNVYCNGAVVGPFSSVSEVIRNINGGKAKGISLIGIKKA